MPWPLSTPRKDPIYIYIYIIKGLYMFKALLAHPQEVLAYFLQGGWRVSINSVEDRGQRELGYILVSIISIVKPT
jgi:hypothetical protein